MHFNNVDQWAYVLYNKYSEHLYITMLNYGTALLQVVLRHIRITESEPYCHSILFVCLSVGHSATYSLPRLIDHNQIWSVLGPM